MKIELSREEKFFQDIIFTNNLIKKQIFTELDYNKLVMLSSSHLMLPSLYYNLKIKKYLHLIPEDLKKYLKNIYNLNRERNSILLSEAFELAGILNKHNIKFRFIKGAFYLIENIYENKDERMIGDIDFLINKIDIDKTKKLLVKSNYRSEFDLIKWETKHLPRFLNPKKIFAIEPHSHILRTLNNKYLSTEKILSKSNTDKFGFLLDICIMNYQVNDYGLLKATFSYKTIYDFFKITKKIGLEKININKNKYYKRFFITTNILGVTDYEIKLNIFDKLHIYRFKLKRRLRKYYYLDNLLCNILKNRPKGITQIIEFIRNNQYRKYILKRNIC